MNEKDKIFEHFENDGTEVFISLYTLPIRVYHIYRVNSMSTEFMFVYWTGDKPSTKYHLLGVNLQSCLAVIPWEYEFVVDYVE